MPKVGMEPIRRRQLIDATITSMGEHGLADTTVQTISRGAGVSPGIIHHYFGGKDELLAATMRSMLQQLRDDATQRLATATSPRARLEAIVDCNFAPGQFEPRVVAAWLGFWAQAPHNPALARLQRINARRLHSNLLHALRPLLPADRAERVAVGLAAMIDGLWLRFALTGAIDGSAARAVALGYLDSELDA
ncbi:BetI family transcriptional regulator [Azospirillum thiophilum]|uniref:HTH-type transcriptional regulator BetI n=1 Tax=Azospirillum thiophilum TaxID=528244 RepID=A0AAC8ZUR8_9PROT|nr:transcriptional regulator BetI [Azospirillum thiophilum]ALG72728.1 BetI family transcriptional regulator [Azospirillum thiophilum]KJR64354.1 BetI family transcriptional regulator [Azospirillum thiophilum]